MKKKEYINENQIIIKIISEDEKYITWRFGEYGRAECTEKSSFYNMIEFNKYKEIEKVES